MAQAPPFKLEIWPEYLYGGNQISNEAIWHPMNKKGQHVVPNGGKWSVRKAGASRASGTFSTQQEAIARGREIARSQQTELYIHGQDGRIRKRDSYGNDPSPPKG